MSQLLQHSQRAQSQPQPFLSWNDAHFCGLRSQTNVYSLSKLVSSDERIKFLAASIDGHLTSINFDYEPTTKKQKPVTNDDVLFDSVLNSNNPENEGEIEIVSIDTVPDWDGNGHNVLAVAYLKLCHFDEDKRPEAFLNIYKMSDTSVNTNNNCNVSESLIQQLSLDFIPFKLIHHRVPTDGNKWENLLLLSGNDHKIHTYHYVESYEEIETSKYFAEFTNVEDCVTQMEIKQFDDLYRLSSFGTQNGLVALYLVNAQSKDILDSWTYEMDSPITSLHFFQQYIDVKRPDFLPNDNSNVPDLKEVDSYKEDEIYNLLVTSALDPANVYHDVLANGLSRCRVLPLSNSQDVVLCSCVMDVDFDGENEVLVGTYGKVLMVYKLVTEKAPVYSSTPFHSPMPVPINTNTPILPYDMDTDRLGGKVSWISGDLHPKPQPQEKDVRRRHRTVAGTSSCAENESSSLLDKNDKREKHRSDDGSLLDSANQAQVRMARSTENLASPSVRSIHFDTPDYYTATPDLTLPPQFMVPSAADLPCYKLLWTRRFCNPLMGLACDDVMGDGMLDLVVLTLKGMHILQPDLYEVATYVLNRLKQIEI